MKHNVIVFSSLISYLFIFLTIIFVIISVTGGLTTLGITAGLLTAALGWALQRPITGIAAWIMIVVTSPFKIGDRIIIGDVRGDVHNITMTHTHLSEFGGTIGGEETSGRIVIIPNSVLFEKNIINYTSQNKFILDEVVFTITYESDIKKARRLGKAAAKKITKGFVENVKDTPFIRSNFQSSGIDVRVRYYTIADRRQEINSKITEEIFKLISENKDVNFAYPHTEVYLNKK
jgi:small-conductance mechanosensitive channel